MKAPTCACKHGVTGADAWFIFCPMHDAAPDLYAALETLLEDSECFPSCTHAVHRSGWAALAKARGE